MEKLKKFRNYALWVVILYLFTMFVSFVGFNLNYKKIELRNSLPSQISIAKAEAKKSQGRIYGYIQNDEENSVNGKYIKTEIYNQDNEIVDIQYLKIDNLEKNEKKMFKVFFRTENAKGYSINLVDSNN